MLTPPAFVNFVLIKGFRLYVGYPIHKLDSAKRIHFFKRNPVYGGYLFGAVMPSPYTSKMLNIIFSSVGVISSPFSFFASRIFVTI